MPTKDTQRPWLESSNRIDPRNFIGRWGQSSTSFITSPHKVNDSIFNGRAGPRIPVAFVNPEVCCASGFRQLNLRVPLGPRFDTQDWLPNGRRNKMAARSV